MEQIFFQNQWRSTEEVLLPASNRSFRYGDGLFESFRWIDGQWIFEAQHWQRLYDGAQALKIQLPSDFKSQVAQALAQLPVNASLACRLTLWRSGAGKYQPEQSTAEWLIEAASSEHKSFQALKDGLQVDFSNFLLAPNNFSAYKTNNALDYVMASIEKTERQLDDLILGNVYGELAEGTYSNIYLVTDEAVLTPSLSAGCLDGTIRKVLLTASNPPLPVREQTLFASHVSTAKELFFTNSQTGVRWVKQCGSRTFGNETANAFQAYLNVLANQ